MSENEPTEKEPLFPVRTVTVKGVTYIRAEDVAAYIQEVGGTENTDVRNRMDECAAFFKRLNV